MENTFAIIKPDTIEKNCIGKVVSAIEGAGLKIVAMKMHQMTYKEASEFYYIHREKPFYKSLIEFMLSGPVVLLVLEGEQVVERYRKLMGPTDPQKAEPHTIRGQLATSIQRNAVHGSDAASTAAKEIAYYFSATEIFNSEILHV